jgi:hypothetical protein
MPGVHAIENEASLSLIPEFDETQLAAARAKAWHQESNPLLTADALLEWLTNYGLVLFAPRPLQLPSPAPSLVEALLGAASGGPTAEQIETAQGFVGRMVADGTAIPLNLMGVLGETPDFVVSAQVFSYVFTLRGDKAWKLPPATSGAVKVSPLGLKAYEVLTEHRQLTALQLAAEMGREVTEAATLRVLVELWSQLRVLPLPQAEGQPAPWELTTRRFTKSIKAGANAGQPSALSALISLYLTQAIAATEEEIVTFLSPLTARSRVREVLHALTGARKLETLAVEGKTLLHLPGALLTFAGAAAEVTGTESATGEAEDGEAAVVEAPVRPRPKKIGTGRISSFSAERKPAAEFRGKPVRSFGAGAGAARGGSRPSPRFAPRADGKSESERRPFRKTESAAKPSFTKPWKEDKKTRPASAPDSFTKYRKPEPEDRKPLGPREQAGLPPEKRSAPKSSFDRGSKPGGFGNKPGGFVKRPYAPRAAEGGEHGASKSFKPRSFEKGAEKRGEKPGGFTKRPYTPRPSGDGERPSFKPRAFERGAGSSKPVGFGAKRPYTPRPSGDGERPSFKPRSFERGAGERSSKPGGFAAKRPYTPRTKDSGASSFAKRSDTPMAGGGERTIPKRPYKPRAADADKRVFTKAPWVPPADGGNERGGKRPYKARGAGGFDKGGAKPRKPFGAKFGGKPAGKFGGKPGAFKRKKPGTEE